MKLTKSQLRQIIKEELEVVLTNEEAGEMFGEEVQKELEEDCGGHEEEAPPREAGDIVTALEGAMRALSDALEYMRGEHEGALGDVAAELGDEAALMNRGPMQESEEYEDAQTREIEKQLEDQDLPAEARKNFEAELERIRSSGKKATASAKKKWGK